MNKVKFSSIRPQLCVMVSEADLSDAINVIKEAEFGGADTYLVNLMGDGKMGLNEKHLNHDDLAKLFSCTTKPVAACFYRWHYLRGPLDIPDEKRMEILLMAAEAGASAVDVEGDFFDPIPGPTVFTEDSKIYSLTPGNPPREFTTNPAAVNKQMEYIKKFREIGTEVLMSAHTRIHLAPEKVVEIYKELEKRGVDMIKIVGVDKNYDDLLDTLEATIELNKIQTVPFIMMSHGEYSGFARWFNPYLGSMLTFVQQKFVPNGFYLQPLLKNVKAMSDNVCNLGITKEPGDCSWL